MIDTHAHLLMFENYGEKIINSMSDDGLEAVVNIGTTLNDSKEGVLLAEKNENIFAAIGIYPEYAKTVSPEVIEELKQLAKSPKVVAIGEICLDYHTEVYDAELQKQVLIEQLKLADEMKLPFCIHCRGAAKDMFNLLSENKHLINHSGLMHCYSEGAEWVQKFLSLGLYISFSGNITYKKSDRSFLKDIPLDRLLIETDAPYLAPEPLRGTKNEPKNVRFVLDKIAIELGISSSKLNKITSENAKRLYYKMGK